MGVPTATAYAPCPPRQDGKWRARFALPAGREVSAYGVRFTETFMPPFSLRAMSCDPSTLRVSAA
jgi:hypothetical protein